VLNIFDTKQLIEMRIKMKFWGYLRFGNKLPNERLATMSNAGVVGG
jgi:hypothetical protein